MTVTQKNDFFTVQDGLSRPAPTMVVAAGKKGGCTPDPINPFPTGGDGGGLDPIEARVNWWEVAGHVAGALLFGAGACL